MLNKIKIRNFKAIHDYLEPIQDSIKNDNIRWQKQNPLTLANLAPINYLIGRNGSGKSSVLEALWIFAGKFEISIDGDHRSNVQFDLIKILSDFYSHSTSFIFGLKNFCIEFDSQNEISYSDELRKDSAYNTLFNKTLLINFNTDKPFKIKIDNQLKNLDTCFNFINKIADLNLPPLGNVTYNSAVNTLETLNLLNFTDLPGLMSSVGYENILNLPEQGSDKDWHRELLGWWGMFSRKTMKSYSTPQPSGEQDKSSGVSQLNSIHCIFYLLMESEYEYILIEEPEISLHPEWQKILPEIFQKWCEIAKKYNKNLQFFITTHSPFIISAAAKYSDTQKVYLLDKGQTVGLDFDPESTEEYQNYGSGTQGFQGYEMKEVANRMLGANKTDIMYSKYILCESDKDKINSDEAIYNKIFQRFEDVKFLSVGGKDEVHNNIKKAVLINRLFEDEITIFGFFDGDVSNDSSLCKELCMLGIEFSKISDDRELESVLYSKEVLSKCNELYHTNFSFTDNHNQDIKPKKDKHCDTYWQEQFGENHWNIEIDGVTITRGEFEINYLAEIIRDMKEDQPAYIPFNQNEEDPNNIYWQLHHDIFGK